MYVHICTYIWFFSNFHIKYLAWYLAHYRCSTDIISFPSQPYLGWGREHLDQRKENRFYFGGLGVWPWSRFHISVWYILTVGGEGSACLPTLPAAPQVFPSSSFIRTTWQWCWHSKHPECHHCLAPEHRLSAQWGGQGRAGNNTLLCWAAPPAAQRAELSVGAYYYSRQVWLQCCPSPRPLLFPFSHLHWHCISHALTPHLIGTFGRGDPGGGFLSEPRNTLLYALQGIYPSSSYPGDLSLH